MWLNFFDTVLNFHFQGIVGRELGVINLRLQKILKKNVLTALNRMIWAGNASGLHGIELYHPHPCVAIEAQMAKKKKKNLA